jgi:hypothetical protein
LSPHAVHVYAVVPEVDARQRVPEPAQ